MTQEQRWHRAQQAATRLRDRLLKVKGLNMQWFLGRALTDFEQAFDIPSSDPYDPAIEAARAVSGEP